MFRSGGKPTNRVARVLAFVSVAVFTSMLVLTYAAIATAGGKLPAGAFAVVNGVALPQSQLDNAVQAQASRMDQPVTPGLREVTRQHLIVREVLRQAAEKAGYGTRPEVQQASRAAAVDTEMQLFIRDNVRPQPITDAQVKAGYDATVASRGLLEYKPRVIAVTDAAKAQRVLTALKSGQDFAVLARKYSVAPTNANGGELPWVSFPVPATEGNTQGLPLPLAQAIVTLPAGGVTPQAVQAGDMWLVAKLDGKRATRVPTFSQAKDDIRRKLQEQALKRASAQLTDSLCRGAIIQQ